MSYAIALGAGRPAPAGVLANSGFIPEVEGWAADLGWRAARASTSTTGRRPRDRAGLRPRRARETLRDGGIEPLYRETEAGHWLPPEAVAEMRDVVADAVPATASASAPGTQPAGNAPAGIAPG